MSENSKIEWTDHTFNPWIGCTKVSPGCLHCYAETQNKLRQWNKDGWGKGVPRKRTKTWGEPVKWNRQWPVVCDNCHGAFAGPCHHAIAISGNACPNIATGYHRARIFCASLADWLDDEVPIDWLADLLSLIHATPNLDWLLLTKRPGNWGKRLAECCEGICTSDNVAWKWLNGTPPDNVWVGTTVEDQARADERIPQLLDIPARVRFLSCEPLLSKVDLRLDEEELTGGPDDESCRTRSGIHWVIAGGESGPSARAMHPEWARSLRDQCEAARVAFLFKQWGEHNADMVRVGKKTAGRILDGQEHNAFPEAR